MEGILLITRGLSETVNNAINLLSLLIPNIFVTATTMDKINNAVNDAVNNGITELIVANFSGEPVNIQPPNNLKITWELSEDSIIQYLGSILLRYLDLIPNNTLGLLARSLIAITGDPKLALMIKINNFDLGKLSEILQEMKSMVIDDIRVLSFIDPKSIKPGLKIMCTCGSSLSYTNNSVIVISTYIKLIHDLIKLVNEGLRPLLIIATPPALDRDGLYLKRELLTLGIPVIMTIGNEGGPHVSGALLNAIFQVKHAG